MFLGSNLISWCNKKQHTIARSSTRVEHRYLAQIVADVTWVQQLVLELFIPSCLPNVIWCDNLSAISLASNPIYHARTKHVEIDNHFIREKVLSKDIVVRHAGSSDQQVDIFTESLSMARILFLKNKLMVVDTLLRCRYTHEFEGGY